MVFFVAVSACWVHVERSRGRQRDPLSRVGRVGGALVLTLIALPGLTLMPLFALKEALPAEAGLDDVVRPGICFLTGAAAWRRLFGRAAGTSRAQPSRSLRPGRSRYDPVDVG